MSADARLDAVLAELERDIRLTYHWIQGTPHRGRGPLTGHARAAERIELIHYCQLRRLALGR